MTTSANSRVASLRVFPLHFLDATWCSATTIDQCQIKRPKRTSTTEDVENVADQKCATKLNVAMATSYFSFFEIKSGLVSCAVQACSLQPLDRRLKWISLYLRLIKKSVSNGNYGNQTGNTSGLTHLKNRSPMECSNVSDVGHFQCYV